MRSSPSALAPAISPVTTLIKNYFPNDRLALCLQPSFMLLQARKLRFELPLRVFRSSSRAVPPRVIALLLSESEGDLAQVLLDTFQITAPDRVNFDTQFAYANKPITKFRFRSLANMSAC